MAMYTLIQFNGDHINDCDSTQLGDAVKSICRNPSNTAVVFADCSLAIEHTLYVVGVTGEPVTVVSRYTKAKDAPV